MSARLFTSAARCHVDVNNNVPAEVKEKIPEFSWSVLWEFVRPQLLALIGAIVVRQKPSFLKLAVFIEHTHKFSVVIHSLRLELQSSIFRFR